MGPQRHWKLVLGSRYLIFRRYFEPKGKIEFRKGPFYWTFLATFGDETGWFGIEMGLTRWL